MKRTAAGVRASSQMKVEVALVVLFLLAGVGNCVSHSGEMLLANVTRFATGDLFSLVGKYENSEKLVTCNVILSNYTLELQTF